jgi:hypothetical protein
VQVEIFQEFQMFNMPFDYIYIVSFLINKKVLMWAKMW